MHVYFQIFVFIYYFFYRYIAKNEIAGKYGSSIFRHLLLGRKAMTNLDSVLKNTDITLPTKVHIVKVIVFPILMHGCVSWTIMKGEHQRIDSGSGEDS